MDKVFQRFLEFMTLEYNATVLENKVLNDYLFVLKIKPDFDVPDFLPGQFAVLGLQAKERRFGNTKDPKPDLNPDDVIRRSYSIFSSPKQKDSIDFYVALVEEGQLTPRLRSLQKGDPLYIGPKITGRFTLDKIPEKKHLLLIATGTGLAPYMSMIHTLYQKDSARQWVLMHGVRYPQDLSFDEELHALNQKGKNFHYLPTVSRPQDYPDWKGLRGHVTKLVKEGVVEQKTGCELSPKNFDVLLCGNPAMIEEITTDLVSKGFTKDHGKDRGQIHTEEYW